MLVDLVLEQQGRYWRKRVEFEALPYRGQTVELLDEPAPAAVVVGISTVEGGGRQAAAAVLLRSAAFSADLSGRLHQAGWSALL